MTSEEREQVLLQLGEAVSMLIVGMHPCLIPEVGSNIVYAIRGARDPGDVAAVAGRIVKLQGKPHPVGPVAFGASDHVARVVLTAMKCDPTIRSAANVRYHPSIIRIIEDLFFDVRSFDRMKEPPGIATMDWGVAFCCKDGVPDIIYDQGAIGKEAMIRFLGENPSDVANNIIKVSTRIIVE
jgi:predicted fused transcriptional regulator/phosphomethylpyrimidine kinase